MKSKGERIAEEKQGSFSCHLEKGMNLTWHFHWIPIYSTILQGRSFNKKMCHTNSGRRGRGGGGMAEKTSMMFSIPLKRYGNSKTHLWDEEHAYISVCIVLFICWKEGAHYIRHFTLNRMLLYSCIHINGISIFNRFSLVDNTNSQINSGIKFHNYNFWFQPFVLNNRFWEVYSVDSHTLNSIIKTQYWFKTGCALPHTAF